jgi:hypothetical protein
VEPDFPSTVCTTFTPTMYPYRCVNSTCKFGKLGGTFEALTAFTAKCPICGELAEHAAPIVNRQPPVRTESLITEATVKAVRSIDIAPHCRIQRINVEPEYSIGDDAHLLSAEVTVKFSLIFPREDA